MRSRRYNQDDWGEIWYWRKKRDVRQCADVAEGFYERMGFMGQMFQITPTTLFVQWTG